MSKTYSKRTPRAELFTELVLEAFHLNGLLIAAGDELTKEMGLSSALWQVLGAVAEEPRTMAQIARRMGLTRQSVRRSARILEEKGFVKFAPNPEHRRARLAALTQSGRKTLEQVNLVQAQWANRVSQAVGVDALGVTLKTMRALSDKL